MAADLADPSGRNRAIRDIGKDVTHGLVLTDAGFHELSRSAVEDLIAGIGDIFKLWIVAGPRLLLNRLTLASDSDAENIDSMEEMLALFEDHGWQPVRFGALEDEARRLPPDRAVGVEVFRSAVKNNLAGAGCFAVSLVNDKLRSPHDWRVTDLRSTTGIVKSRPLRPIADQSDFVSLINEGSASPCQRRARRGGPQSPYPVPVAPSGDNCDFVVKR